MFIDSHAHLTTPDVYQEIDSVLARARAAGVETIINICTNFEELEKGLALAKQHPWIHNAAATTPHDVEKEGEDNFPLIAKQAKKLVAIGETGLDAHYEHSPLETQKAFCRRYLHLALEHDLPVIIHCREAFQPLFEILDRDYSVKGKWAPGVLHCFTGTGEEAKVLVKHGWFISFSGIVTFKKSDAMRDVAKSVPLDHLLIETDTPYLAPQKYRGKRNEPAFIVETAQLIAEIKGISVDDFARATAQNARRFFRI